MSIECDCEYSPVHGHAEGCPRDPKNRALPPEGKQGEPAPARELRDGSQSAFVQRQRAVISTLNEERQKLRIQAEGSDWRRDAGESLEDWALRKIKENAALREQLKGQSVSTGKGPVSEGPK